MSYPLEVVKISRYEKLFMTNVNYFFVKNIVKTELNNTERQKLQSSLKKSIYYLRSLLSISKIAELGKTKKQCKRFWVRKIYEKREQLASFHTFLLDLKEDREYFFQYFRMTPDRFEHLLELAGPKFEKRNTRLGRTISPRERLAITLRYLAFGKTQKSLSYSFRIGRTTVSNIISETYEAIFSSLKGTYLNDVISPKIGKTYHHNFKKNGTFPTPSLQ